MIVVEGLDNTGKTTLVDKLRGRFGLTYYPSPGNKHDPEWIRSSSWQRLLDDRSDPCSIHDRNRFISEYIYNPILKRRELAFDQDEWFDMLKSYFQRPQLIIYCIRPLNEIGDTFNEKEQLEGVYENLYALQRAYDNFMKFVAFMASIRKDIFLVTYNFDTKGDYDSVCFWVEKYLKHVDKEEL